MTVLKKIIMISSKQPTPYSSLASKCHVPVLLRGTEKQEQGGNMDIKEEMDSLIILTH
jgi:hypothetical protein